MPTELTSTASGRRSAPGCGRPSGRQLSWALAFGVSLCLATLVLRHLTLPAGARYLVPVVPLLAGVFYMRALVDDIRRQKDELQLRIHMEAAAVVVCGLFVVMLVYPLLEAAHLLGPLNYDVVLVIIVALGCIGYFSAQRRYR